jgi:hypothetical protein
MTAALLASSPLEDAATAVLTLAAASLAVLLTVGSSIGLHFILLAVAPEATRRVAQTAGERSLASFFMGLPVTVLWILGIVAFAHGAKPLAVLAGAGFVLAALFGGGAACEDLGRRVFYVCGKSGTRAGHVLTGWSVGWLAAIVPIAGWFVVAPYLLCSGIGAIVLSAFRRGSRAPARIA